MKFSDFLQDCTLNEESLSRFFTILNSDKLCFGILTASRSGQTPSEDKAANKELQALVRSTGFGYRKVLGHYPEEIPNTFDKIQHIDNSIIIVANYDRETELLNFCKQMMKRYDQDSILFKHADGRVLGYNKNGTTDKLGKFHANKISDYMSTFKNGRTFVFDNISEKTLRGNLGNQWGHMRWDTRMKKLRDNENNFYANWKCEEWFFDDMNEMKLDW